MSKKYDRQIDILNYLMHSGRTTICKISYDLGACVHTVKRDIADLQYHFPIFTYVGRGGGVELNACFFVNGYLLKRKNVMLIKYSLECLAQSSGEYSASAQSLLHSIFHEN